MGYTVEYFINKFEAIPEEEWCVAHMERRTVIGTQRCAFGHCGVNGMNPHPLTGWNVPNTTEGFHLDILLGGDVEDINDGEDARYQQPTPKERILAALRDVQLQQIEAGMSTFSSAPNGCRYER